MRARAVATLVLALLPAVTAAAPDETDALLARAGEALQAGRHADAERLYREAIAREPGLADAWSGLARVLETVGRPAEAQSVLLRVGQGLVQSGNLEDGVTYLTRALALGEGSAPAHAALGHALLRADRFDAAARHLRRAVELGEGSIAVRVYLGSALWERGELDAAERVYRETLDTAGAGASAVLRPLAALLVWRGRYAEALPLLQRAASDDTDSVDLQYDLARALDGSGQAAEAIAAYRRVIELAPGFAQARYRLAVLLDRTGDRETAAQELARFRELHDAEQERTRETNLTRARLDRGWRLIEQGRPGEAVEHFRELPVTVESLSGLAAALAAGGDASGAAAALEQALLRAPDRGDLRRRLDELRLGQREGDGS